MTIVTMYSRPGCGVCDSARTELLRLSDAGLGVELREVNIDEDPRLLSDYLERIPVIEVDGQVISELQLDLDAVRSRLDTVLQ